MAESLDFIRFQSEDRSMGLVRVSAIAALRSSNSREWLYLHGRVDAFPLAPGEIARLSARLLPKGQTDDR